MSFLLFTGGWVLNLLFWVFLERRLNGRVLTWRENIPPLIAGVVATWLSGLLIR